MSILDISYVTWKYPLVSGENIYIIKKNKGGCPPRYYSPPVSFGHTDSRCNGFVLAQQQSFPIQSGKHSTNSRTKSIRPELQHSVWVCG